MKPVAHTAVSQDETSRPTLEVEGLSVDVVAGKSVTRLVEEVTFHVGRGEVLGLVGESGSGKSVTALGIMGLLPSNVRVSGRARFAGKDLLALSRSERRSLLGAEVAMIFQDAARALNPAFKVGDQIAEAIREHRGWPRKKSWDRAVELMARVDIPRPAERAHDYPHMLSGGQNQRVMLAMALACNPTLLIADEPTTALDVTVQHQILDLLREIQAEYGLSVIFITHDLGVVAQLCDRVAVMYSGQLVEVNRVEDLFLHPGHPYTSGLITSVPTDTVTDESFRYIPGVVPLPGRWPPGCRFHRRCKHAVEGRCDTEAPTMEATANGSGTNRCLRRDELQLEGIEP